MKRIVVNGRESWLITYRLLSLAHSGGFRYNHLNWVGWSALLGSGMLVGLLACLLLHPLIALPGGIVLVWITALLLEERSWRRDAWRRVPPPPDRFPGDGSGVREPRRPPPSGGFTRDEARQAPRH